MAGKRRKKGGSKTTKRKTTKRKTSKRKAPSRQRLVGKKKYKESVRNFCKQNFGTSDPKKCKALMSKHYEDIWS